jgi:hypothetical protein
LQTAFRQNSTDECQKNFVSNYEYSPVRSQRQCLVVKKKSPATRHDGAWGEKRYSSYSFLTSTLDGGEWSASRPRFTPGERTPGTHCTGGWVGPRAGLDTEDRGKILCLCRGLNPDRPVVQSVVRHYTACMICKSTSNLNRTVQTRASSRIPAVYP